jgi:endophilin-A
LNTSMAKLKKTAVDKRYPHAIGDLAEAMSKGAADMGDDSIYGSALQACADSFGRILDLNHDFDSQVQQNLLEPLKTLMEKDLKEISKHRKKLEGRRLDFDYKRRKQTGGKTSVTEADIKLCEQKMEESKAISESAMANLIDNETEQISQIAAFVQAYLSFTQSAAAELEVLNEQLQERLSEAAAKPRSERRSIAKVQYDDDDDEESSPTGYSDHQQACARAIYDFEAENKGELSFNEGDTIILTARLDENWLQGEVHGKSGIFPSNYVDIIRDI